MLVYRITTEKYAKKLSSSGVANRWNLKGQYIIYAAESRSLASLELVVHRSSIIPHINYKILVIEVDLQRSDIQSITEDQLPFNWRKVSAYNQLQRIGSSWYENKDKLVLEIPSAVIPKENNYMINTQHASFDQKVRILDTEEYFWDHRLLQK